MRRAALASAILPVVALSIPGTLRAVLYGVWIRRLPLELRDGAAAAASVAAALAADGYA